MMKKPPPLPEGSLEILRGAFKIVRTKEQYQHLLCLWLRGAFQMTARQIGPALGLHPTTVRTVQARFLHEGVAMFRRKGRGGRHRQNLTVRAERELLVRLCAAITDRNGALEAGTIQRAYERAAGHPVSSSVIYRMLRRNNWRRLIAGPVSSAQGWAAAQLWFDSQQAAPAAGDRPGDPL